MSRSRRAPARATPNPSGVHFLSTARIARQLVRDAEISPQELVVEFGPGPGALTSPLSATGATVLAVERDEQFVQQLRKRFDGNTAVRVVHADARHFCLPRRRFRVVANIPFGISGTLLRRLLNPARGPFGGADLVVEWGLAKRLTAAVPRSAELAWWNARFDIRLHRRIPATAFAPEPRVDAAHLAVRRGPDIDRAGLAALWALLERAYREPDRPAAAVLASFVGRGAARSALIEHGHPPRARAGDLAPAQWAALARKLARQTLWPRLPTGLR